MSRKPEESRTKKAQAEDKSQRPAKHIEEIAKLPSSEEPGKNPEKVRRAKE
jgi:hypothetical protein